MIWFEIIFLIFGFILALSGIIGIFTTRIDSGTISLCIIGTGLVFCGFILEFLHLALILVVLVLLLIYIGFILWILVLGLKDSATYTEDAVIVLGEWLRGNKPSPDLEARLTVAADYYHKNPGCIIVVTGGKGDGEKVSEAFAMEQYLLKTGVPKKKILKEDRSVSTKENMRNTKQILENYFEKNCKITIVTSNYHIYRGKINAHSAGFQNITTLHSKTKWYSFLPNATREALGILAYYIFKYA